MFPSILIVDDEPSILQSLSGLLSDEGFEVSTASNGYEALKTIEMESPDLVLLDIWMPGIDGIDTLKEIRKINPHIPVIMITGHGTIETAVKSSKIGAYDFIEKPLSIDKTIVSINNALNFRRLEEENHYLRKKTIEKHSITGNSQPIIELKKQIALVAPTDEGILISGENGTGKELVARTIHQFSRRSERPMIDIHCAMIPDEHIESELFGHERGAFPGAAAKNIGKFELASKGTIFFDEIADMSLRTQGKILRVLEERKFQRLGGTRTFNADIRVIASTNKNLEKEIEKGSFREDLYYRLNVIPIEVPPLRHRLDDLPLLINLFLDESAIRLPSQKKTISPGAVQMLRRYDWPGNIRELKNLVERLTLMVTTAIIDESDIPTPYNPIDRHLNDSIEDRLFSVDKLDEAKALFEKEFIRRKLEQHQHNIEKTAAVSGIEKNYLYAYVNRLKRQSPV